MHAGYMIFAFGLLLLFTSYVLYRLVNAPRRTTVTARELDAIWTNLGKLMVGVYDNNTEKSFLKDLDEMVKRAIYALRLESKNEVAEGNKKELHARLRELKMEIAKASAPYRIEIRKHRLRGLAALLGMKLPKGRI